MLADELIIEADIVRVSDPTQFASVDPEIAPFNCRPQAAVLQQDLLHALPQLFVDPVVVGLVAFASRTDHIPPVVLSRLHERHQTHVV